MKILVSVSYYIPHISGLTNAVKNLSELLAGRGYQVTVLTTQHQKQLPKKERISSVDVVRVPYLAKISKGFFMPSYLFTAIALIKETDRILINLPQFEGFLIGIIGRLMGKKVICIYYCEVALQGGKFSRFIESVLRLANFTCLVLSETIITLSDDFAKHSALLAGHLGKVKAIYPVIYKPGINSRVQGKFTRLLPAHRKKYIGFLGRIAAEKGIEYLLAAVPYLQKGLGNNFAIVLAGPMHTVGEKEYVKKIAALIETYHAHIIQLGELGDDELGAFYQSLDVLVIPSINSTEAFGMVQVEAMLCGTPVVVTDLPGVSVPVQLTGMGEIAKCKNAKALAEKIVLVINKRKEYVVSRDKIDRQFDKATIAKTYDALFAGK